MSAKLTSRQVGDVTVIDAAGRITLGDGASSFRDTIRDLAAKGNKKLIGEDKPMACHSVSKIVDFRGRRPSF